MNCVHDPLGQRSTPPQPEKVLILGSVDTSEALVEANTSHELGAKAYGTFMLDVNKIPPNVDYFGELSFTAIYADRTWPIFTGTVVKALPSANGLDLQAITAVQLQEKIIAGMTTRNVTGPEMIYTLARSSGIREDRLKIDGLDALVTETLDVYAPIAGLRTDKAAEFGGVQFLPSDVGEAVAQELNSNDQLLGYFGAAAYARATVSATRMLEAEHNGLAAIDLALAWLTTQLRYGAALRPDGEVLGFERMESLTPLTRGDVVYVSGQTSQRRWLRRPAMTNLASSVSLAIGARALDRTLPSMTLQGKLAFQALYRAANGSDELMQVQDLFEAIEFYCSGVSVPELFSRNEIEVVRRSAEQLSFEQRRRVDDIAAALNSPPLMARLRQAVSDDGVSISDGEFDLLRKLRKLRNDVVHGRKSDLPIPEDVQYATSIVARFLIYGIPRLSVQGEG